MPRWSARSDDAGRGPKLNGYVGLVDSMLDACNAAALAFKVYLLTSERKRTTWPQEVLLQELHAATSTPWWKIQECIPTKSAAGDQLNIHVSVDTRDDTKVFFSCVQTAVLAQGLVPGYQRYFFSLRSPLAWPGWAGFDGAKLAEISKLPDATIADYASALNDGLVFYVPKVRLPKLVKMFDNYRLAFQIEGIENVKEQWRSQGNCIVDVREVKRHTNPLLVTKAWVIMKDPTIDAVRENAWSILGQVLRASPQLISLVPPGYTDIEILEKDCRRRDFSNVVLGPHHVCRITLLTNPRMERVDLLGSRVEEVNGLRIGWNRNWRSLGSYLDETR